MPGELIRRTCTTPSIEPFKGRSTRSSRLMATREIQSLLRMRLNVAVNDRAFPLGVWLSASFLDLFGGDDARPAAETLVAFGLAAAVPTALAGAADWSTGRRPSKRVGAVHAGLNGAVAGLYACSLIARRKRRHALAVALGIGGGTIAWASGYLGGHLSLVRGVGPSMHSRHEDIENPSDR